jgi:hypothetical protein
VVLCAGGFLGLFQGGVLNWTNARLIAGDVAVGILIGLWLAQLFGG